MTKYYVYELINPINNQVFYVGKGTKNRAWSHTKYLKANDNSIKANTIRKILEAGLEPVIKQVFFTDLQEQADMYEEELISKYGRKFNGTGILTNISLGGGSPDIEVCRLRAIKQHQNMTEIEKDKRSYNCSIGQRKRYQNQTDTDLTKKKKSMSHQGQYMIISPDGEEFTASQGLKVFAETIGIRYNMSYWQLYAAYRRYYTNKIPTKLRKDSNTWKVIRLDEPNNTRNIKRLES